VIKYIRIRIPLSNDKDTCHPRSIANQEKVREQLCFYKEEGTKGEKEREAGMEDKS
jgi:hypothetical protein